MPDGRRLFARYRVRLGFPVAVAALLLARPTPRSLAVGAAIAIAGEALRIWAAGHLAKGREVTTSGPYRFTRHPLYVGSAIIGIGLAIACASAPVAVLTLLYLGVTLTSAVRSEERHLTDKFGPAYPAYREGRAVASSRPFSASRVVANREHRAMIGLALALALLALKAL
jgi:protein-S-isoprenylcysteine O-methyltransferase Ste14